MPDAAGRYFIDGFDFGDIVNGRRNLDKGIDIAVIDNLHESVAI